MKNIFLVKYCVFIGNLFQEYRYNVIRTYILGLICWWTPR